MDGSIFLPLVQSPQLPAFVLGIAVPWVYRALAEGGASIPDKAKVWFNLFLSATVAFAPILVSWYIQGIPTAEVFFSSITAAFVASELSYRQFLKSPAIHVEQE
jgi:hypothetical protein